MRQGARHGMVFDGAALRGRRGEALPLACGFDGLRLLRSLVLGLDVTVGNKVGAGVANDVVNRVAHPTRVLPVPVSLKRVANVGLTERPGAGGYGLPTFIGGQQDSVLPFGDDV